MEEWSDDDADDLSHGEHGAESHPDPQKVIQGKRHRVDDPPVPPTKITKKKGSKRLTGQGSRQAKPTPTGPILEEAALEIPPLRFAMPSFAANLPRAEG